MRRTAINTTLLVIAAVIPTLQAAHAACRPLNNQNLVTNGGFEKIELKPNEFFRHTNNIVTWRVYGGAHGELQKQGRSGKQKVELASTHGYKIAQHINLQAGRKYLLRFWGKYRKPQFNKLNVLINNHPNNACGTPKSFTVNLGKSWKEYSYEVCPNANHILLEFGQQRNTGGGYGLHLDDVSLAPCQTEVAQIPPADDILLCPHHTHYTAFKWNNPNFAPVYIRWTKPYGDPAAQPVVVTAEVYSKVCNAVIAPDPADQMGRSGSRSGLKGGFGRVRGISLRETNPRMFHTLRKRWAHIHAANGQT